MQLKVAQLEEHLVKREESAVMAKLGEFSVSDDSSVLTLTSGVDKHGFLLDEVAYTAIAKYLKVPASYFNKLDPDFRATLMRYEFERNSEVDTVVESLGGEVVALHQPSQVMIPMKKVVGVIEKVFDAEDTVRRLIINENRMHVDVTTDQHKMDFGLSPSLLGPSPSEDSVKVFNAMVGDVTEAGIRFLAHPFRSTAPSVNLYAERLVCTNGMTTEERLGRVNLKGLTVDEVIAEMETAANMLLPQLDGYLTKLTETRTMFPPGSPQAFVAQLAREANVSRKVLDAVLDIVNQLTNPSVWEIQNAFTEVANEVESYANMVRLQVLGGDLAFDAEKTLSRCGTCEKLL